MTTDSIFVRYSDVGITSGLSHESEEQIGRGGEAASSGGAAAAGGAQAGGGGRHGRCATTNGVPLEERARSQRDRSAAHREQGRTTGFAGRGGIGRAASCADGRTDRAWLWHATLDAQAGARIHRARVRGSVQRCARLAPARADGVLQPEAGTTRPGARRGGDRALEEAHLAGAQKKPAERAG